MDESIICGDTLGLIRMGIIFLNAGLASDKTTDNIDNDVAIRNLIHEESEIKFRWIDRADNVIEPSSIVQDTRQLRKRIVETDRIVFWLSLLIGIVWFIIKIITKP